MRTLLYYSFFLVLLASCTETDSNENIEPENNVLYGYIQKGPFIAGDSVTAIALSDSFVQIVEKVYSTLVENDLGAYSIELGNACRYYEIFAKGHYFNEVSGEMSASELSLSSIMSVQDSGMCNINILTTLTRKRILNLINGQFLDFESAREQAENELFAVFGLLASTIDINRMDIAQARDDDAKLLALSCLLQGDQTAEELAVYLEAFAGDFTLDGDLDDPDLIQKLEEHAKWLNPYLVASHLESRYEELGLDITVPDFSQFIPYKIPFVVTSLLPQANALDVGLSSTLIVSFSNHIDSTSLNESSFAVSANDVMIGGDLFLASNGSSIIFKPYEPLASFTNYTITVNENLKALDGSSLGVPFQSKFRTEMIDIVTDLTNWYKLEGNSINEISEYGDAVTVGGFYTYDRNEKDNSSYKLDDYGDYIEIPHDFDIDTDNWTFSLWFKLDKLASEKDDCYLLSRKSAGYESDVLLYVDNDDNAVKIGIVDGQNKISSGIVVEKNIWYQAAVSVSEEGITLYVNGEEKAFTAKRFTDNLDEGEPLCISPPTYMGSWLNLKDTSDPYAKVLGDVDDIRLYKRCLNAKEIKILFDSEVTAGIKSVALSSTGFVAKEAAEIYWP